MWTPEDDAELAAIRELEQGSDRSLAVISGAMIDSRLGGLIRTAMRGPDTEYSKKVRGYLFHPDGPLGSFGSKISVSYLLGLFSEDAHTDLTNLKNIRNLFAHYAEHNSFDSPKLKALCANFRIIERYAKGPVLYMPGGDREKGFHVGCVFFKDGVLYLHTKEHAELITTAKGRFSLTAQLFLAALHAVRKDRSLIFPLFGPEPSPEKPAQE